jgi:hypothetical protein
MVPDGTTLGDFSIRQRHFPYQVLEYFFDQPLLMEAKGIELSVSFLGDRREVNEVADVATAGKPCHNGLRVVFCLGTG